MKQFVSGYPGQAVYRTEWQSPVGTSHTCLLKTNLTSFLVWRLKPRTLTIGNQWPYESQHSTTYLPSLGMLPVRASFYFYCMTKVVKTVEGVVPSESDTTVVELWTCL